MSQARFQKSQREKARIEKMAAKQERRAARAADSSAESGGDGQPSSAADQQRVLDDLALLHDQLQSGAVDFETFEERKSELIARLDV